MTVPYQLANYLDTNITYFQTDNHLNYYCRVHNHTKNLSPVIGIFDIEVHELEFYSETPIGNKRIEDQRVKATIYKIQV